MKKLNKKGFTLIELLAVIAILAILVVMAVPGILTLYKQGKEDAMRTQAKSILKIAQDQVVSDDYNNMNTLTADGYTYCNGTTPANSLNLSSGDATYYIHFTSGVIDKLIVISNEKSMTLSSNITAAGIEAGTIEDAADKTIDCTDNGSIVSVE